MRVDFPIIELDGTRSGTEGIWCTRLGFKTFKIDNIPFAVRGICFGDVVECRWSGRAWVYARRRESGGLSCARVYCEAGISDDVWSRIVGDLEAKYEFASEKRAAVAAPPATMEIMVDRVGGMAEMAIEVTAEP